METKISSLKQNPLMERTEIQVNITHTGGSTPSKEDVKDRLAAEEDWNSEDLEIGTVETGYGRNQSVAELKIDRMIDLDDYEDAVDERLEDQDSGDNEGSSYEEVVSGTIGEAKEALQEIEEPDYQAALEAEKDNKDRKTLKEWIQTKKK